MALITIPANCIGLVASAPERFYVICTTFVMTIIACMSITVRMLLCLPVSDRHIAVVAMVISFGILLADLHSRTLGHQFWPVFVPLVDLLLVMRLDKRYSIGIVVGVVLWLILTVIESASRFGLYDIPFLPTQKVRRESYEKYISCDTVPCPEDVQQLITMGVAWVFVFVFDFVATRGFANQVLREQEAMERTIATVEEIATRLTHYDVDTVAHILDGNAQQLPEGMHLALRGIEANLRLYRPYLPASLFEKLETSERASSFASAPGLETEIATIVFTDIRLSTLIWEAAPSAMRMALSVHNQIMRTTASDYEGYEVKTIGDAFMLAFENTAAGVNFALTVQERLLAAAWPISLQDVPVCRPHSDLWGGITVRIGINTGQVAVEQNALTGRMDYFGHTVNVASRLEGSCLPGAVAMLLPEWDNVRPLCVAACSSHPETMKLKGVAEAVLVTNIWPMSLARRKTTPLDGGRGCNPLLVESLQWTGRENINFTMAQGTIGVVDLSAPDVAGGLRTLNAGLEAVLLALDLNRGTVISVCGGRVSVGWNLTRISSAHAESSVRFAQRLHRTCREYSRGVGIASGVIHHGEVGSRTQRFFAVVGAAITKATYLCSEEAPTALYSPPPNTVLPAALGPSVLIPDPARNGVYLVSDDASLHSILISDTSGSG